MKLKTLILLICILCLAVSTVLCGCKNKNEQGNSEDSIVLTYPPYQGTEGSPDEEGIILGDEDGDDVLGDEDGGSKTPPSLTAPAN